MKFDFAAIFENIVSFYAKLPMAQKIALPLLVVGSMGLIVFVSRWAAEPEYRVLFSNLEEADASGVVEYLKENKIGFRLKDSGKTIEITPPKIVHELRLDLAAAGLPKGGNVGYELFNDTTLGQTGFVEKLNATRALQGELERTIQSLDAVKSVRVHITNPEPSVFTKRDVVPTASILVRLKAGASLGQQQIKGMVHLVAGSVERLTADNVTILDSKGNLLNEVAESEELGGADLTKLEYQRSIEKAYVKRIETMLGEVLGRGKAVARVTADVDFSKLEREEEAFDPGGQVIRSERSVSESAGLTADGGVPGVISNLTNDPGILTPPDSTKNANRRSENVKNFEISRSVSRTVASSGKIAKLSVAVLVDGQYVELDSGKKDADGKAMMARHYKPLTVEMMRKIENLVKQAVGFDTARGDVVTVENIRFAEADVDLAEVLREADTRNMIWDAAGLVLPAILILLFFIVVVKPLIAFLISPTEAEVDLSRLLPAGIEELEAELEAERAKSSSLAETNTPVIDIEELENLLAENSRIVKENPQQAALLIRYWLNDGRL